MAIYAVCKCGKKFGFKNEAAGRQVKCPACGAMIALPGGAAAPKAEAEPELTFADEPKTGRSPAVRPSPGVGMAPAMGRAARPLPAPKKAAPKPILSKTVLMAIFGVLGAAAIAAVIALLCGVLRNPWASGPAQPADVPVAPTQVASPRFAEVRLSPKDYVGRTVNWYGEFLLAAGSRVIYVGAKSSDGRSTYRFVADYGRGAKAPEGHGYVTGKVAGTESITESVSRGGVSTSALVNMPLVKEATFEPGGDLAGGPSPLEIIEAAPSIFTAIQPPSVAEPEAAAPAVMVAPAAPATAAPAPVTPTAPDRPGAPEAAAPAVMVAPAAPAAPAPAPSAPAASPRAPAAPAAAPAGTPLSPEKEQEALALLKKYGIVTVSYEMVPPNVVTSDEVEAYQRAVELLQTFVQDKGPVLGLRPAAGQVAPFDARAQFFILVYADDGPQITEIQQVLGPGNLVEQKDYYRSTGPKGPSLTADQRPDSMPVVWYNYNWLAFATVGGKVVAVRADCRRLRRGPLKVARSASRAGVAADQTFASTVPANMSPELQREWQALALLGTSFVANISNTQRYYTAERSAAAVKEVKLAMDKARETLEKFGLANGLRVATAELAKYNDRGRFFIVVIVGATPKIAAIQAILGKEAKQEQKGFFLGKSFGDVGKPTDPPVTWYHYGWMAFATVNGEVVGVRVDCSKFTDGVSPAAKN